MEFKEFVSLFPFSLMLAVTFMLFYFGDAISTRRDIMNFIGILMLLSWLFLLFGFVAGLTLAKLHTL
jgi:Ca2+/Na+ antiporter